MNSEDAPYMYNTYTPYNHTQYNLNSTTSLSPHTPFGLAPNLETRPNLLATAVAHRQQNYPTTPLQPDRYTTYSGHQSQSPRFVQLPPLHQVFDSLPPSTPSFPSSGSHQLTESNPAVPTPACYTQAPMTFAPADKENVEPPQPEGSKSEDTLPKSVPAPPKKQKGSKKPKASTKQRRGKGTGGAGSRSGAGRRNGGDSEDEIKTLAPEDLEAAGLKFAPEVEVNNDDEEVGEDGETKTTRGVTKKDKLYVVKYMVARYKNWRVKQMTHYIQICAELQEKHDATYRVEQIKTCWLSIFEKYKAVRVRQEHTGGGDGDEDSENEETRDLKRKRTTNSRKFSTAVLDAFENSEFYELIDKVAHDDESVVRPEVFNSVTDVSDSETPKAKKPKYSASQDSDHFGDALQDTMLAIKEKAKITGEIEREKLELMRQKEKREETASKYDLALRLLESSSAAARAAGERMLEELRVQN